MFVLELLETTATNHSQDIFCFSCIFWSFPKISKNSKAQFFRTFSTSRPRTLLLLLQCRQDSVLHFAEELTSFPRVLQEYWHLHSQKLRRFSYILLHSKMPYTFLYTVFTVLPSTARHSACSTAHPSEHVGPLVKCANLLSFLECVHMGNPNSNNCTLSYNVVFLLINSSLIKTSFIAPETKQLSLNPTLTDFYLNQNYINVYLILCLSFRAS
jgi:hypothetical protein